MKLGSLFSWTGKKRQLEEKAIHSEIEEIRQAHLEWEIAVKRFDHANGQDEIDYAIFAIEAAEKRYEMLLKQAKSTRLNAYMFKGQAKGGAG